MSDLISRHDAIKVVENLRKLAWDKWHETRPVAEHIIEDLKDLPSAEPEIIRCRDCKRYMYPHGCNHIDGMTTAQEDGYCSYAERREK